MSKQERLVEPAGTDDVADTMAKRALERTLASRQVSYAQEIRGIIDATYRVIERTGTFDPTLRDILRESGLSTQAFYKHFRTKDELLLVLLDDGRRQLLGYLTHRMDKATTAEGRVRAWIEGVLAQAADTGAASRTRPFMADKDRLREQFPEQQQRSVDLLVDVLAEAIEAVRRAGRAGGDRRRSRRDAFAIYHLAFGVLHWHLAARTRPTAGEVDHLVRFSLNAISDERSDDRG